MNTVFFGSFAVVALMCGLAVTRVSDSLESEREIAANLTGIEGAEVTPAQIASTLTLLIGVLQVSFYHYEFLIF